MAIINGTAGNDELFSGSESDTINGFAGNDKITGNEGNDLARMGAGNDRFFWHLGDGSDTLRGQAGFDTLVFECSAILEGVTISRNATRAIVSHSFGTTMDLLGVERIYVQALAGVDTITINNLAGTDVTQVLVDLASAPGIGSGGDGEIDTVARNGGSGNDIFNVALVSGNVSVTGPAAAVTIRNADTGDFLEIAGLGGNDTINASKLPANIMRLSVDGGTGNDIITGSRGSDLLQGDSGNDVVAGGRGNDFVDLGTGNDLFAWSQGHGSDTIQGGDGTDTLLLTGAAGSDTIVISAIGGTAFASYFGGKGNADINADGVERIRIRALAGGDTILLQNDAGTDVSAIDIDLAAAVSGTLPDHAVDSVIVNPFAIADDVVHVAWSGSKIVVDGLTTNLSIAHADSNDLLRFDTITENLFDASNMPAGKITLRFQIGGFDTVIGSAGNDSVLCLPGGKALAFLGAGNDSFQGFDGDDVVHMGAGNDMMQGGSGNDVGLLGAGNDTMDGGIGNDLAYLDEGNDRYVWSVGGGNDSVDGGGGIDTLRFNGSTASETIKVGEFDGRGLVARNASDVDLNDVERIRIRGFDGKDNIFVSELAGTDIKLVAIDLAGAVASASDGEIDNTSVAGSVGNDLITLTTVAGVLSIVDLTAKVTVSHFDTTDLLGIDASSGNDTISAAAMKANSLQLSIFGGDGRDVVTGSAGRDALDGGNGADTLRGGGGSDQLVGGQQNDRMEGGDGKDILIGNSGDDVLFGGSGDDTLFGDQGNDTITGGAGNDLIPYTTILDGHDVILAFDGNPTGGQDTLNLGALFANLGVAPADRAARVSIVDKGATVNILIDADGDAGNGFEVSLATLHTLDKITVGQDVMVGV